MHSFILAVALKFRTRMRPSTATTSSASLRKHGRRAYSLRVVLLTAAFIDTVLCVCLVLRKKQLSPWTLPDSWGQRQYCAAAWFVFSSSLVVFCVRFFVALDTDGSDIRLRHPVSPAWDEAFTLIVSFRAGQGSARDTSTCSRRCSGSRGCYAFLAGLVFDCRWQISRWAPRTWRWDCPPTSRHSCPTAVPCTSSLIE